MADVDDESPAKGVLAMKFLGNHWKGVLTVIVPILFYPIMMFNPGNVAFNCLYLIAVCCIYWITECIPLYVTSLVPVLALPLLGVLSSEMACQMYFKNIVAMFMGSLIVALSIEYCNFHRRLALKTILLVGCSPRRLHFGLMCVTCFISFWITNSATTAMMCPIVKAVLTEMDDSKIFEVYMPEEVEPAVEGKRHPSRISLAFYFGICYASTVGGCGTLIGTATNLTFKGIYDNRFPDATEKIGFPQFMGWTVPMVIIDTLLVFVGLQVTHMGLWQPDSKTCKEVDEGAKAEDSVRAIILEKYEDLGPISVQEWQVLFWFMVMVVLLFTGSPGFMTGWMDIMNAVKIKNSIPIMLPIFALFLFPMTCFWCAHFKSEGPYPTVREKSALSWEFTSNNIPWGLLFLMGGGFALAEGSTHSGMAELIGKAMTPLKSWSPIAVQLVAICGAVFLTNFSANVPISNIYMPIMLELALAIRMHPIMLIFPTGIACSMAFHLPVGTPPNAIIAGYAGIRSKYMAEAGILPTIIIITMLMVNIQTMHYIIYPAHEFPAWAEPDELT